MSDIRALGVTDEWYWLCRGTGFARIAGCGRSCALLLLMSWRHHRRQLLVLLTCFPPCILVVVIVVGISGDEVICQDTVNFCEATSL